jgi:hypothetical protein
MAHLKAEGMVERCMGVPAVEARFEEDLCRVHSRHYVQRLRKLEVSRVA